MIKVIQQDEFYHDDDVMNSEVTKIIDASAQVMQSYPLIGKSFNHQSQVVAAHHNINPPSKTTKTTPIRGEFFRNGDVIVQNTKYKILVDRFKLCSSVST
jgi:hypothetical protein